MQRIYLLAIIIVFTIQTAIMFAQTFTTVSNLNVKANEDAYTQIHKALDTFFQQINTGTLSNDLIDSNNPELVKSLF